MEDFEEGRGYIVDSILYTDYSRNIRARKTLWVGLDGFIYTTKKDALQANGLKSKVKKMRWDSKNRRYMGVIEYE